MTRQRLSFLSFVAAASLCLLPSTELARAEGTNSTAAAVAGFFGNVAVQTTVTRVGTLNADRKSITIQNNGPNPLDCAPGTMSLVGSSTPTPVVPNPALTSSNGLKVAPGGTLSADLGSAIPLYCVAETANQSSPADTRYWEFK